MPLARWLLLLGLLCAPLVRAQDTVAPDPWLPMARFVGEWQR